MSEDRTQFLFDTGEDLAHLLAHLEGCESALMALLDEDLARRPDMGRSVFAVLEAQARFRQSAQAHAQALTRYAAGRPH